MMVSFIAILRVPNEAVAPGERCGMVWDGAWLGDPSGHTVSQGSRWQRGVGGCWHALLGA